MVVVVVVVVAAAGTTVAAKFPASISRQRSLAPQPPNLKVEPK